MKTSPSARSSIDSKEPANKLRGSLEYGNRDVQSLVSIGILGLGTVGSAVVDALQKSGFGIRIKKVCDLRKKKAGPPFTSDPYEIINDPEISIVVEAIGGVNPALKYILAALDRGKSVVTPNKEVIAKHGEEIFSAAARNGAAVLFEGAVGGGIPIIRGLREGLAGSQISEIYGIVNGTTNYILNKMTEDNMEFSQALKSAKEKGFAEADPRADIDGYDAQYKAAILAAVAWGVKIDLSSISREGISRISREDIRYADEIGYVIKLLAVARKAGGKFDVRVHPTLVSKHHPLAAVSENYNAIYVKGKPVGEVMFYGPGAGGGPTASAIISDLVDIARHGAKVGFSGKLSKAPILGPEQIFSRYYFHLKVPDRPGVLAQISRVFAQNRASIQAVLQKETIGKVATLIIMLHETSARAVDRAAREIARLPVVKKISNIIRII